MQGMPHCVPALAPANVTTAAVGGWDLMSPLLLLVEVNCRWGIVCWNAGLYRNMAWRTTGRVTLHWSASQKVFATTSDHSRPFF